MSSIESCIFYSQRHSLKDEQQPTTGYINLPIIMVASENPFITNMDSL